MERKFVLLKTIFVLIGIIIGFFVGFSMEETYIETKRYDADMKLISSEMKHNLSTFPEKVLVIFLFSILFGGIGFSIGLVIEMIYE